MEFRAPKLAAAVKARELVVSSEGNGLRRRDHLLAPLYVHVVAPIPFPTTMYFQTWPSVLLLPYCRRTDPSFNFLQRRGVHDDEKSAYTYEISRLGDLLTAFLRASF